MTWFPHFLSPIPAAITAAVAVPLLLLLYFLKLRRREVPVSSTFLWKKAVQDLQVNSPFQRLRRNLLLFLQLALLVMLLLALSRPVSNFTPGTGKLSVILIDRSASMSATDEAGGKSRLDEAKRRAKDLVSGLDRHGLAKVIAFDDNAETVQTFTSDVQALKRAIDGILPTDRKSRLKMAFQLADAKAADVPDQLPGAKADVRLYSDGRVLDASELSLHGELKYEKIGTDAAGNIAIVALDAKRNYDQPAQVQVFARLANFGPKPATADVKLTVDGNTRSIASVSLAPDRWSDPKWVTDHPGEKDDHFAAKDSVEFSLDMTSAGVIKVEQMNKDGDLLAADDSAQVVVPPPKALSVLLVTSDNVYLERAVNSMSLQNPKKMPPEEYEEKQPKDFDVIMFDRYYPQWMPDAGNFIYFGCAPTQGKLQAVKTNEKYELVEGVNWVLDWQRDNPMLRHLNLSKLWAMNPLKLTVPPEAQTLVDGMKGPLIVLNREERRTHLVIFDIMNSDWPLKVSFPVFLHSALQYLALGSEMNVRPSYDPGSTPRIPRANLERAGAQLKSIKLLGPAAGDSQDVKIPATGDFVLPALDKVGVYKTEPPIPQYEELAVNLLDDSESNLVPSEAPPGQVGTALTSTGGKSRLELWWWIVACCAIPLLMIEWWVYTRRVHL